MKFLATCRDNGKFNEFKSSSDEDEEDKNSTKRKSRNKGKKLAIKESVNKSPKFTRRSSKGTKKAANKIAYMSTDESEKGVYKQEEIVLKIPAKKIVQTRGRKPAKKIFPTNKTAQSSASQKTTVWDNNPVLSDSSNSDSLDSESKTIEKSNKLSNRRSMGIRKRRKKMEEKLIKLSKFSSSSADSSEEEVKVFTSHGSQKPKKTRTPRQFNQQRRQYRSSDDDDDDCCSSGSPQPLNDRLPMLKLNTEPETINMGGEPDIINMGGEPDEDVIQSLSSMEVLSPKAPLGLQQQEEEKILQNKEENEINEQQKLTDSIVTLLEEQNSMVKLSAEFCSAEQQQHSQQILLMNSTLRVNIEKKPSNMIYQSTSSYIPQEHLSLEMVPQLVQSSKGNK